MATLDPFTQTIMTMLMNAPALRGMMPEGQAGQPARIAPKSKMDVDALMAAAGGGDSAELPQGTFTPQRDPAPAASPDLEQGPLGRMLGLSPDTSKFFRRVGAGMDNVRGNPYGDPFITAAQGFGGAQAGAQAQDDAAAAAAANAEKTAYDRRIAAENQARSTAKDQADLKIRQLAEDRQQRTAKLANEKTAVEIKRLARGKGVTTDQYLRARAQAQKDADDQYIHEDRDAWIEKRTNDLLDNADRAAGGGGLSGKSGVSQGGFTAYNEGTGQTLEWRDGQWVDQETGEPFEGE